MISLLGKFTSPLQELICYPENMVIELRQNRDFEEFLERSKTKWAIIFKHSTQCSISSYVYEDFRSFVQSQEELTWGLVLVIENRGVSDAIAERLQIRHESPQVILIRDGRAVWHASQWNITAESLNEALSANGEPAHQRN